MSWRNSPTFQNLINKHEKSLKYITYTHTEVRFIDLIPRAKVVLWNTRLLSSITHWGPSGRPLLLFQVEINTHTSPQYRKFLKVLKFYAHNVLKDGKIVHFLNKCEPPGLGILNTIENALAEIVFPIWKKCLLRPQSVSL